MWSQHISVQFDFVYLIAPTGYLQRAGCSFILSQYITSSASALSEEVSGLNVLPHSYVSVTSIFWDPIELLPVNISGDLYAVHFS